MDRLTQLAAPDRAYACADEQGSRWQPREGANSRDLLWLWMVMRKRKRLIIWALLAAVVPTGVYVAVTENVYRSTVTIQISPEPAKVLPYHEVTDPLTGGMPNFDLYMKTQDELLRSRLLRIRTAERLSREHNQNGHRVWKEESLEMPTVMRVEGSQIIKLSYQDSAAETAAAVANAWADEFISLHLELRHQTSRKAAHFLQAQLKELKQRVEDAERAVVQYAQSNQLLDANEKQDNVVRQRLGFFAGELSRTEREYIASKAELEGLRAVTLENYPESLKGPAIVTLEGQAHAVEQELARMMAQFDEKWPAVAQKRQELAVIRRQLNEAQRTALARAMLKVQLRHDLARNEYEMLSGKLREQELLVGKLNAASVEYSSLKREFEASEQLYQGLLQRLKETGVSSGLEFGNIQIADRARPERAPYRPRRGFSMLMATVFGLMLGVAVSVGREYFSQTLEDPWSIEQYGLPLLGWVPRSGSSGGAHGHIEANGSAPKLLPAAGADEHERNLTKSEFMMREAYRAMSVSTLLSQPGGPPRVILVTSAIPREGKTTTTTGFGKSLAEMGMPVLLVDADFRRQSLSRLYDREDETGLSTYLAGGELAVHETAVANLSILPAGIMPPNPVALFNSARFAEMLSSLRQRFKFILVDAPPVLSAAEVGILAMQAKHVMFVVNTGSTPVTVIRQALSQIERSGATIIGAVANQVDLRSPEYSHYGKYYYGENGENPQSGRKGVAVGREDS